MGSVLTLPTGISGTQIVGNCNNHEKAGNDDFQLGPASAFIYDIVNGHYVMVDFPGFKSISLSGIVQVDPDKYVITGSISKSAVSLETVKNNIPFGTVFTASYNSLSRKICNFNLIEIEGFNCHFSSSCGISNVLGEFQIGLNVVPIKNSSEIDHVKSFWLNLTENMHIDVIVKIESKHPRILTGIYGKNFVGFKEKKRECDDNFM